ncbi:outer membrane beta-barrel protein [Mucilaginibacter sp. X5P1]|uniref:outer membrane beta-barrel protein n=1 Tax=Mucilaginibacter sp. X5P1 TaxID=2723088 RepID=UPI00161F0C1B|nr:outer membrane beta-barrel protein [Mucilaginibacter sp. X5P1]MBB6140571.1 hypothetical protein [Mucilaginibacter sp. X5P1]
MKKVLLLMLIAISAICVNAQTKKKTTKTSVTATSGKPKPVPRPVIVAPKTDEYSVMDKNFLDPGVGLGTYYKGLPFGVSFEHGFTDDISAGAFVNYSSYNDNGLYNYSLHLVYVGVRGSYHFAKLLNVSNPKFDPYAGVSLGYYSASYNYAGNPLPGAYGSTVFLGVHAGARYMFSNSVGGFAEVGYGVSALQVGLSFKF